MIMLGRWASTAALSLFLLLSTGAFVQAQDRRDDPKPSQQDQDEAKPNQPEPRHDAAKPGREESMPRPEGAKPAEQSEDRPASREEKPANQDDAKPASQGEHQPSQRNDRAQDTGDRRGGHIPDDKFRSNFGRQHTLRVRPSGGGGQPTFQYGGYSFVMVDAWPADWAYTDDCYIDYIDGDYFLFDLAHPGTRLAIVVVL